MTTTPPWSPVIVSTSDLARLRALVDSLASELDPLGSLLHEKLKRAELREPDHVPNDTVTLDRFVTYRTTGSDRHERRLLIHPEDTMWPPAELSAASPLGITLLGLAAGDRVVVAGSELSEPPWVEVLAVEAAPAGGFVRRRSFALRVPGLSLADRR